MLTRRRLAQEPPNALDLRPEPPSHPTAARPRQRAWQLVLRRLVAAGGDVVDGLPGGAVSAAMATLALLEPAAAPAAAPRQSTRPHGSNTR